MIWILLILGLPLPVWLLIQAPTPEYFFQTLAVILLAGIPVYLVLEFIVDWTWTRIQKIRHK